MIFGMQLRTILIFNFHHKRMKSRNSSPFSKLSQLLPVLRDPSNEVEEPKAQDV